MTISGLQQIALKVAGLTAEYFGGSEADKVRFLNEISRVVKKKKDVATLICSNSHILVFWQGKENRVFSLLKEGKNELPDSEMIDWRNEVNERFRKFSHLRFQVRVGQIESILEEIQKTVATVRHGP